MKQKLLRTDNISSAVVLAAGYGKRLRPLTDTVMKPLLPLAETTLLTHNLKNLARARIERIFIVIPRDTQGVFKPYVDWHPGLEITFVEQERPLGTAHAVDLVRTWVEDGFFLVCYGDNATGYDLQKLVKAHLRSNNSCTVALNRAEDPKQHSAAEIHGDRICRIIDKPNDPATDLTFAGMCVLPVDVFGAINAVIPSGEGEYYLPDAIQLLISNGLKVGYERLREWRLNVNGPKELMEAHCRLLQTIEHPLGTIDNVGDVTIRPPVVIAPNVIVSEGCCIGPNVTIAEGCFIGSGSQIEHCILLPDVRVGNGCALSNVMVASKSAIPDRTVCQAAEPYVVAT